MTLTGRKIIAWLGCAAWLLCAPPRAPRAAEAPANPAIALREMADLEGQIEKAQRQQLDEQKRLLEANRSLQNVDATLRQKSDLNKEGEQFLKNYGDRARTGLESATHQIDADRQAVRSARTGLALSTAALLSAAASPASSHLDLLGLGLLQDVHRTHARIASQEIQDLEARQADLAGKRDHAARSAEFQTVFSQSGLAQLRQRHQALAVQVAEAQAHSDAQSQTVQQLAGRREELKKLLAGLAKQEAEIAAKATPTPEPAAVATPATEPAVPAPAIPAPLAPTPAPAIASATTPRAGAGLGEVPYEDGSEPMASTMRAGEDKNQTDASGTRYLFWRARPVGVRALAGGKVLFSGPFAGYRHLLILDHGGGWRSLYGNLVQTALKVGDGVTAGQAIGQYEAVSGSRAEPLWFEVRQGTQASPPEQWPGLPEQWQSRLLSQLEARSAEGGARSQ